MRYHKRNFSDDFMEGEVHEIMLSNTTLSCILNDLEPHRNYTVNVYAISKHNTTMGSFQSLSYPVPTSRLEFITGNTYYVYIVCALIFLSKAECNKMTCILTACGN